MRVAKLLPAAILTLAVVAACGGPETPARQSATTPAASATESMAAIAPSLTPSSAAATLEPSANATATPTNVAANATTMPEPTPEPSATPEPTATPEPPIAVAEDLAPALGSIDSWHNSAPLALTDLIGRPVLLVFWADY